MARTVILRRDFLHYIKKYNRFEKRHHNLPAHLSPAFSRTRIGDIVTVGQCKKLSKTVLFNVIRVEKKRVEGNVRKTFCMFWAINFHLSKKRVLFWSKHLYFITTKSLSKGQFSMIKYSFEFWSIRIKSFLNKNIAVSSVTMIEAIFFAWKISFITKRSKKG